MTIAAHQELYPAHRATSSYSPQIPSTPIRLLTSVHTPLADYTRFHVSSAARCRLCQPFWKFCVFVDTGCIHLVLGEIFCFLEIGSSKLCPGKVGSLKLGRDKVSSLKVGSLKLCPCKVGSLKLCPCKL